MFWFHKTNLPPRTQRNTGEYKSKSNFFGGKAKNRFYLKSFPLRPPAPTAVKKRLTVFSQTQNLHLRRPNS